MGEKRRQATVGDDWVVADRDQYRHLGGVMDGKAQRRAWRRRFEQSKIAPGALDVGGARGRAETALEGDA